MKPAISFFGRAAMVLLLLVLLVTGMGFAGLSSWRADKISLLDGGGEIAPTLAGPVEFQRLGEGPAVLVLHGGFGGYDQGMSFVPGLVEAGFLVIAPSRPGYLRTPLAAGVTNEEQADAMAALLDTLGVRQVAVVGISVGGPVAVQFARRHPDRARALVLVCAVAKKNPLKIVGREPLVRWGLRNRTLADLGSWYGSAVTRDDPHKALEFALMLCDLAPSRQRAAMADGVLGDPGQRALFLELADSTSPLGARLPGICNDLRQMTELGDLPFGQVQAPTLVIHGTADKAVKIDHARLAASRIPQATLCEIEDAGHLLTLGPRGGEAKNKIINFLIAHPPALP